MSNQEKPTLAEFNQWMNNPITKAVQAKISQDQAQLNRLSSCPLTNLQDVAERKGRVLGMGAAWDLESLKAAICQKGSD